MMSSGGALGTTAQPRAAASLYVTDWLGLVTRLAHDTLGARCGCTDFTRAMQHLPYRLLPAPCWFMGQDSCL